MASSGKFTPAILWRAFFILAFSVRAWAAGPSITPPSNLAQVGLPDAAEAQRILSQFRQSGIAGVYYLEFELRELPRRGEELVMRGKLWGGRNDQGAVTRIVLVDGVGAEHRFLLQNGPQATVWRWGAGRAAPLEVSALFEPIVPGVELSAFDLQMPFLFWPEAKVVSITRIRGRPAHAFVFRPPTAFASKYSAVASVRSYFDAQFNAPTQTELLDPSDYVIKTLALLDLKKVAGQYIPKSFEVRDEITRNKTRLVVMAAALNLEIADQWFSPATLGNDPAPIKPVRLDP